MFYLPARIWPHSITSSLAQLFAQKSISSEIEEQQLNHNHREVNVSLQQSNQLNLQHTSKACHRADAIDDGDDRDGKNAPSVYSAAEAGTQDESEVCETLHRPNIQVMTG